MSIAETIKKNLATKEGRYLHSFVIVGESGDAKIPEGVCVRFYNCNIGTLTMDVNCIVSIDGGTCKKVEGLFSDIIARGMTFTGDLNFQYTKGDFFNCTFLGQTFLDNRSYLRTDSTTYTGGAFAIKAASGSQGRATRCTFSGHATAAVKVEGGSYFLLSACSSVIGVTTALWADDRGIIEAVDCPDIQGTGVTAVKVSNYGRVQCMGCASVQGALQAVVGETHGQAVFNKCDTILGLGDAGAKLDSNAGLEVRLFTTFKGMGNSAVIANNMNYVYFLQGQTLESASQDALELHNGSHGHVTGVLNVKGSGRHGVNMDLTSELTINDVLLLKGGGGHGILAATKCNVQVHEVTLIQGVGGHGVKVSDHCTFASFQVATISGDAGNGVDATDSSVSIQGTDDLIGKAGHGANLTNSNFIVARSTNITGQAGDGINASSGSVSTLSRVVSVTGQAGNGVTLASSTLASTNVNTIVGQTGDGVKATLSLVRIRKSNSVNGGAGHGVNAMNSDVKTIQCPSITGAAGDGIHARGRGIDKDTVEVDRCTSVAGSASGIDAQLVRVISRGSTYAGAKSLTGVQIGVTSEADSFNGNFSLETSSMDATEPLLSGSLTLASSTLLRVSRGTCTGSVTTTDSEILGDLFTATGNLIQSGGAVRLGLSTFPAWQGSAGAALDALGSSISAATANASSFHATGGAIGTITLANGNVVAIGSGSSFTGSGRAASIGAGVPGAGVDYLSIEADSLVLQDSSMDNFTLGGTSITLDSQGSFALTTVTSLDATAGTTLTIDGTMLNLGL